MSHISHDWPFFWLKKEKSIKIQKVLWRKVSEAIANDDQNAATEEKTVLEEAQRAEARIRKETGVEHKPQHFEYEAIL